MREEELVIVATIAFGMGMHISVFPYPPRNHPSLSKLTVTECFLVLLINQC